ncbi:MAG: hypothetical protein AAB701_00145 [Patescibacteria group bacterium]
MSPYQVDRTTWQERSFIDQMANIGSEVGRSLEAKQVGKPDRSQQAMLRALDLFDATTEQLVRDHSPRTKEVLRAKEQFLIALTDSEDHGMGADTNSYFLQFGQAARCRS